MEKKAKPQTKQATRLVCQNKKAFFDYEILETFEAGMVLVGTEVKSLREGRANLKDSYAKIRKGEVFLYINYFGIKGDTVLRLSNTPNDIIIDNSQAFFSKPIEGIDTFYSARKFFGVSDGAYLYTDKKLKKHFRQDISFDRMLHLLKRIDISANYGYESFKQNEHALSISEIRKMSVLTGKILSSVNYKGIQKIREENFLYVHEKLKDYNELHIDINAVTGPMTYPFLRAGNRELREEMHRQKIYAPTYWPNVFNWCQSSDNEYYLAENIIPIPIDQRITHRDLNKILELILN